MNHHSISTMKRNLGDVWEWLDALVYLNTRDKPSVLSPLLFEGSFSKLSQFLEAKRGEFNGSSSLPYGYFAY